MRDERQIDPFIWADNVVVTMEDARSKIVGKLLSLTDHRAVVQVSEGRSQYDGYSMAGDTVIIMTNAIATIQILPEEPEPREAAETPQEAVDQTVSEIEGTTA